MPRDPPSLWAPGNQCSWCRPGPVSPGARCPTRPARRVLMATAGPRGRQRATAPISVPSSPGAWRSTPRTWAWQALKGTALMMLHCFWAHDLRYGLAVQGSLGAWASGQDGENFQLLPNSSTSPTTDWLRVVKSLRALSSKFPHSPQTLPCGQTDVEMAQAQGKRRRGPATSLAPPRPTPGPSGRVPLDSEVSRRGGHRRSSLVATECPPKTGSGPDPGPTSVAQSRSRVSADAIKLG